MLRRSHRILSLTAACGLRTRQERVQECTAGVGIHFDELRPAFPQVEVIARHRPTGTKVVLGHRGGPGENSRLVGWRGSHRFDGVDDVLHRTQIAPRQENGHTCKQVRPRFKETACEGGIRHFRVYRLSQATTVQSDAEAVSVQDLVGAFRLRRTLIHRRISGTRHEVNSVRGASSGRLLPLVRASRRHVLRRRGASSESQTVRARLLVSPCQAILSAFRER